LSLQKYLPFSVIRENSRAKRYFGENVTEKTDSRVTVIT